MTADAFFYKFLHSLPSGEVRAISGAISPLQIFMDSSYIIPRVFLVWINNNKSVFFISKSR
ncbi:hypothetical protein OROGR_025987 [Orobanche gracilis]